METSHQDLIITIEEAAATEAVVEEVETVEEYGMRREVPTVEMTGMVETEVATEVVVGETATVDAGEAVEVVDVIPEPLFLPIIDGKKMVLGTVTMGVVDMEVAVAEEEVAMTEEEVVEEVEWDLAKTGLNLYQGMKEWRKNCLVLDMVLPASTLTGMKIFLWKQLELMYQRELTPLTMLS